MRQTLQDQELKMKHDDRIDEVRAKLIDAHAINGAVLSELLDTQGKLQLVSENCRILDQAITLIGIERDYIVSAIERLGEDNN